LSEPRPAVRYECVSFNTLPHKEIDSRSGTQAGFLSARGLADPVAESDLAEVATGFD